jgi:hypothetical protein
MGCAGSTPATKETGTGIGKCLWSRSVSSFASRATPRGQNQGFSGLGGIRVLRVRSIPAPPPRASRGLGKDFGGAMQGSGWGAVNCAAIVWLQELGSRVELVLLAPVGADCQIQVLNFG